MRDTVRTVWNMAVGSRGQYEVITLLLSPPALLLPFQSCFSPPNIDPRMSARLACLIVNHKQANKPIKLSVKRREPGVDVLLIFFLTCTVVHVCVREGGGGGKPCYGALIKCGICQFDTDMPEEPHGHKG